MRGYKRIEEKYEANQRPIDDRGSITSSQEVVTIGFCIDGCDLSRFQTRMLTLEPGGKATTGKLSQKGLFNLLSL